nr:hypothetical protein [Tanacetum cinerariifolium]
MNKLVRHNLVRGLPTKCFENDHNCTACLKGKQHKASCKFEAKGDEGYFLGYSMSSKAFRVFNKKTKRVEENLHVEFLENKAIEKGYGLNCGNSNPTATLINPPADQLETLTVETPIPTVSSPVPTVCFTDSQEPLSETRLISKRVTNQKETPSLDNILTLSNQFEDILGVTTNLEESNGVEADVSNMEISITASPTPTLRIHTDHPKSQIIDHVDTPIQTRNKSKEVGEQSFIATIHQKTDPAPLQFCIFSCFLSQVEPKKVSDALQDPRVRPIGTKWVLKNKKDERGIVIRNKARLVAQGHTQEEGIDYDEVFAPVARIEAIRLFLAYASFMGFTLYQMNVKSAFLYGTIDEEVYVMQPPEFQDLEYRCRTLNVNVVCATCKKCLVDSDQFACVTQMLNDVNARTKKPNVLHISTRKPKGQANKSVATPHKKKVASKSTNQKPQSYFRMLKSLGESISVRDSFLVALQTKQVEFEKFKAFNDRTIEFDKLEHLFCALTAHDMEILIQTCLMPLAIKTQSDSLKSVHELKQEMHADLKYVKSLEKEIDELAYDKAEFLDMYDVILQECVSKDVMCSYLQSLSDLEVLAELQCMYLHNVKECECFAQRLLKQTESVSKKVHTELLQCFAKVEKHSISLKIALQNCKEQGKVKSVDTKFDRPSVVRQPNAQRILKPSVLEGLSKPVTAQTLPQTTKKAVINTNVLKPGITKNPTVVPISTRKPKSKANKSIATPNKKKVASKSTKQKPQSYFRVLYENTNKAWKWWIERQSPSGYKWVPKLKKQWVPKAKMQWVPKANNDQVQKRHMAGNLKLLCNFVEKFLGTVRFGNDQFALILGYGDLVQGNVTINSVYYVEGLNHNLFSVGQFCDADLETKQTEFEKYKAFNDRTIDYDKLERKLNEALGQLAHKDTVIREGLKTKAYELSVVKEKHDKLMKPSLLTMSHYKGLVKQKMKVITDLKLREEHDIEKMLSMEKQLK